MNACHFKALCQLLGIQKTWSPFNLVGVQLHNRTWWRSDNCRPSTRCTGTPRVSESNQDPGKTESSGMERGRVQKARREHEEGGRALGHVLWGCTALTHTHLIVLLGEWPKDRDRDDLGQEGTLISVLSSVVHQEMGKEKAPKEDRRPQGRQGGGEDLSQPQKDGYLWWEARWRWQWPERSCKWAENRACSRQGQSRKATEKRERGKAEERWFRDRSASESRNS